MIKCTGRVKPWCSISTPPAFNNVCIPSIIIILTTSTTLTILIILIISMIIFLTIFLIILLTISNTLLLKVTRVIIGGRSHLGQYRGYDAMLRLTTIKCRLSNAAHLFSTLHCWRQVPLSASGKSQICFEQSVLRLQSSWMIDIKNIFIVQLIHTGNLIRIQQEVFTYAGIRKFVIITTVPHSHSLVFSVQSNSGGPKNSVKSGWNWGRGRHLGIFPI